MSTLLLASSSKYRKAQLNALGLTVKTQSPDIDETPHPGEAPDALACRLASQKARKVGNLHPDALTLGSDQVAVVKQQDDTIMLGKPGSFDNAVRQLSLCQGNIVTFYTALAVYQGASETLHVDVEITRVHFRPLSEQEITGYVEAEQPLDCAGSFKCEGLGALLFERIDSRDPNSLIGLPVMLLRELLAKFDIDLLTLASQAHIKKAALARQ
ncbi:septum formation protein Maf [Salinimonas sp. HHU 13199]|uniref:7-methyl-GTP pyrophosphatase n=1 Tax=Salinimonas profundi TaxID=2729140 RepID=A0ABR8LGC5_9ALTE|nr:nucleoside triphosphate pyrophosphatase [Salinimonas profundi]MBD3584782.1 septum formation protein Maf [Salinimonas profundi]